MRPTERSFRRLYVNAEDLRAGLEHVWGMRLPEKGLRLTLAGDGHFPRGRSVVLYCDIEADQTCDSASQGGVR